MALSIHLIDFNAVHVHVKYFRTETPYLHLLYNSKLSALVNGVTFITSRTLCNWLQITQYLDLFRCILSLWCKGVKSDVKRRISLRAVVWKLVLVRSVIFSKGVHIRETSHSPVPTLIHYEKDKSHFISCTHTFTQICVFCITMTLILCLCVLQVQKDHQPPHHLPTHPGRNNECCTSLALRPLLSSVDSKLPVSPLPLFFSKPTPPYTCPLIKTAIN